MEFRLIKHPKLKNNTRYYVREDGYIYDKDADSEVRQYVLDQYKYRNGVEKNTYKMVILDGHMFKVHRLVAENFIKYPFCDVHKLTVNHKDGNTFNNHYTNLAWNTQKSNVRHAFKTGLSSGVNRNGANHYRVKLTENDVRLICEALENHPSISIHHIANMIGYSVYAVDDISRYKSWVNIAIQYKFIPRINIVQKMPLLITIIRYIRRGMICNEILSKLGIPIKNGNTNFRGLYEFAYHKVIPMLERIGYYRVKFPKTYMMETAILKFCYPKKYGNVDDYILG